MVSLSSSIQQYYNSCIQSQALVVMDQFVWSMELIKLMEDLKYAVMETGGVSVQLGLIQLMLMLFAMN